VSKNRIVVGLKYCYHSVRISALHHVESEI